MRSFFVKNGSVDLHVLENGAPSGQAPSLLVIGGLWEPAERAIPLLSDVPGHVVALSFRGRGLIIVDQPPVHQRPGPGYVEFWSNLVYLGVPILNFMRRQALDGLERDAAEVSFYPQLSQLHLPVAVFVGRNKAANIPSDLPDAILRCYTEAVPSCEVVEFCNSGHMIPDEEPHKYVAEITAFMKKCTAASR